MSWSGFKKNVGRATTQVMVKTGRVEKTNDREYEVEERRYRTLEAASTRLQKEAKGYLDSLRAMTASQMRIAETIDAFYGDSGAKDGVSRSYKQAVEDLDAETVKALDGPYRCVPDFLFKFAEDENVIKDIEEEWNFGTGNKRVFMRKDAGDRNDGTEHELMDYLSRTTVLEPINRFCAYFPDINECIKKRQHKMLDYDAMRSKVRKLTEKPDKDPSKLPRTEKETEMVSTVNSSFTSATSSAYMTSDYEIDLEPDLSIPSPPKAIQRPEIQKLRLSERSPVRRRSIEFGSSIKLYTSPASSSRNSAEQAGVPMADEASAVDLCSIGERPLSKSRTDSGLLSSLRGKRIFRGSPSRNISNPAPLDRQTSFVSTHEALGATRERSGIDQLDTHNATATFDITSSTPFFQPSELEDFMRPFKLEFAKKQADELEQAKAAYEQLNEQLTTELPQLIDLRVPYLDPTFEALVKIQLRFCAEAYSRMAQVQQYLDPSTRDQYAAGDLDARVEDVLGQIRELSIAGTV